MDDISTFARTLMRLERLMAKLDMEMSNIRYMFGAKNMALTYDVSLRVAELMEKAVLVARALPAYTGVPDAEAAVARQRDCIVPIEIGFTSEGWFSLRMPMLLPKKEKGSADYIRSILFPAMQTLFRDKPLCRFKDCVLIYRHVYSRERPERQRRDHDNIEINMVSDIVALYTMLDDAPSRCRHYYCSAEADAERTEVYVVPVEQFVQWLASEKEFPESGPELSDSDQKCPPKDMSKWPNNGHTK